MIDSKTLEKLLTDAAENAIRDHLQRAYAHHNIRYLTVLTQRGDMRANSIIRNMAQDVRARMAEVALMSTTGELEAEERQEALFSAVSFCPECFAQDGTEHKVLCSHATKEGAL